MRLNATVLQVVPALNAGGAERTALEIAEAVTNAGGRAVIAASGGRWVEAAKAAGAVVVPLPLDSKNPIQIWRNRAALLNLIKTWEVDLVHARSRACAWSALWAARAAGVPFVTTYHGFYSAKSSWKRFYNSVMTRGERVIANSDFMKRHILGQYAVDEDKLIAIPRGVDLTQFHPDKVSEERRLTLAEMWGLEPDDARMKVLLPGRLTAWKGQSVAIEAAKRLKDAGREADYLFILAGDAQGRDGYEAELRAQIREMGVGNMVGIVGHCEDMPAAYALSNVVLSTSIRPEAFGRIAVEAQAMERPVIASDHGGARETVVSDVTGWLVSPGDSEALADALQVLGRMSVAGRRHMGTAGREHVTRRFSLHSMCAATLQEYGRVLGEGNVVSKKRRAQRTSH